MTIKKGVLVVMSISLCALIGETTEHAWVGVRTENLHGTVITLI